MTSVVETDEKKAWYESVNILELCLLYLGINHKKFSSIF